MTIIVDTDLDELEHLDELRRGFEELCDQGILALTSKPYTKGRDHWEDPGDVVEQALVLRVIRQARKAGKKLGPCVTDEFVDRLVSRLRSQSMDSLHDTGGANVPMLAAARVMQALVESPGHAFCRVVVLCYYRIVRELHTASPPEWRIGGARAGDGARQSPFITGECFRAVLGLADTLDNTAVLFDKLQKSADEETRLEASRELPRAWFAAEQKRADHDLYMTLRHFASRIMGDIGSVPTSLAEVRDLRAQLPAVLRRAADAMRRDVEEAHAEITRHRASEKDEPEGHKAGTETAHLQAMRSVERSRQIVAEVRDLLDESDWRKTAWARIAEVLRGAHDAVRRTLAPARHYAEAVLDQQLAARAGGNPLECDGADLVFAAASHGALAGWEDPRLVRAEEIFKELVTEDGGILCQLPIQALEKGIELYAVGAEIIRAYGYVLGHLDGAEIDATFLGRFLRRFKSRQAGPARDPADMGWHHQMGPHATTAEWWTTALVVHALFRLTRMLDHKINRRVFQHFQVRRPDDASLGLADLFYSDTGLDADRRLKGRAGVCSVFQAMHAHLLAVHPLEEAGSPVCSAVLHGPPGTGKTTLLVALAGTAGVPMIEVTPSDIVVGGMEQLEKRARDVFKALCMARRAVILFDEFDPILHERTRETSADVFSFLTPGMLPKLRRLNEHAREHQVVFALATNRIGSLDDAAIRPGRFDVKIGLYPPDLLSRVGRLVSQLAEVEGLEPGWRDRLAELVFHTAQGPMTTLGLPGWYTVDRKMRWKGPDKPLRYVAFGGARPDVSTIPDKEWPARPEGRNRHAIREWEEWGWIVEWDRSVRAPNWAALRAALEELPAVLCWSGTETRSGRRA